MKKEGKRDDSTQAHFQHTTHNYGKNKVIPNIVDHQNHLQASLTKEGQYCSKLALQALPQTNITNGTNVYHCQVTKHKINGTNSSTPSLPTELALLESGINWRVYGQGRPKGGALLKKYYKCQEPSCMAKKIVQKFEDGSIKQTYQGDHRHLLENFSNEGTENRDTKLQMPSSPSSTEANAELQSRVHMNTAEGGNPLPAELTGIVNETWQRIMEQDLKLTSKDLNKMQHSEAFLGTPPFSILPPRINYFTVHGGVFKNQQIQKELNSAQGGNAYATHSQRASRSPSPVPSSASSTSSPLTREVEKEQKAVGSGAQVSVSKPGNSKCPSPQGDTPHAKFSCKNNRERSGSILTKCQAINGAESLEDGYKWKKYGTKSIKKSQKREYFKCTHEGCCVKRRVDIADTDPKNLVVTYEGHHNHKPPLRVLFMQSSMGKENWEQKE